MSLSLKPLKDQVVVITGASSGIGRLGHLFFLAGQLMMKHAIGNRSRRFHRRRL